MTTPQTAEAFDPDREVNDYLETVTVFENDDDPTAIREWCRTAGITGRLTWHLGQGGTQKVELLERTKKSEYPTGKRSVGEDF